MQKRVRVPCGRALSRARFARMSTVSHAMRFYIARRRFRVLRVCFLHRPAMISHTAHAFASSPMISHVMRSFTSPGGDFVRRASFYIACLTSAGGDFAHCARFYIARRRFRVLRMCFLHRTAVISHTAPCFTSPGDDFTLCTCAFYIARRRFRSSCVLLHERKGKI